MKWILPVIDEETGETTDFLGSYTDGKPFSFSLSWHLYKNGESLGNDQKYDGQTETFVEAGHGDIIPVDWNFDFTTTGVRIWSNNPTLADKYEPVKSYMSHRLVITGDMYKSISEHTPCTKKDLQEQTMHYTGKTWAFMGINGYTLDGYSLIYNIPLWVKYKTQVSTGTGIGIGGSKSEYKEVTSTQIIKIQCIPDKSMARFRELYAQECTPQETDFRNSIS